MQIYIPVRQLNVVPFAIFSVSTKGTAILHAKRTRVGSHTLSWALGSYIRIIGDSEFPLPAGFVILERCIGYCWRARLHLSVKQNAWHCPCKHCPSKIKWADSPQLFTILSNKTGLETPLAMWQLLPNTVHFSHTANGRPVLLITLGSWNSNYGHLPWNGKQWPF